MRKTFFYILSIGILISSISCKQRKKVIVSENEFVGSQSCIECHENFYKLWSPSHHGKAMEPIDLSYIQNENLPESEVFTLEGKTYQIEFQDSLMFMIEKDGVNEKRFDVVWALGGKNVSYFLTPMENGKLQTIPLAYDYNKKMWYNNPESAVRHFPDGNMPADEALPWKDRMYTFNTSCYSCHISQLQNNFDISTDSYNSTWKEPGINCETCHGPSGDHIRIFRNAKEGEDIKELGLISTKVFTPEQHNASCAPCHAKMRPITPAFMPGDRYFDNYDLTTLENSDFYPDGRDLGENYTFTQWNQNQCVKNSDLHCVSCHTSSGRNRFKDNPNDACISCHQERKVNLAEHTGHKLDSEGSLCVNCHMPKTEFGRMIRSEHSFRPPMPEGTIKFGSPNACNICHTDKTPEWANKIVKARPNGNYQDETMKWAQLIFEARNNEWKNLDEMLEIISKDKYDEVVVTSLIRLINNCNDNKKWPVMINTMLTNKSPLVRSAAATGLMGNTTIEAKDALTKACTDEYRLVRISAALPLAVFSEDQFTSPDWELVKRATDEYTNSIVTRPDDWSSHYNLGIFQQNRGDANGALNSYEVAARLYPESLMPLINSSVLYSYIGNQAKAEENLKKVIEMDPGNEAANLNLGLLLAEQGRLEESEKALKAALQTNPEQAVAAKNLSVIVASRSLAEAVEFAEIAAKAQPENPEYAYTLAYYQMEIGQKNEAIKTLKNIIKTNPQFLTATSFLAEIYLRDGKKQEALLLFKNALKVEGISAQDKQGIQQAITSMQQEM